MTSKEPVCSLDPVIAPKPSHRFHVMFITLKLHATTELRLAVVPSPHLCDFTIIPGNI